MEQATITISKKEYETLKKKADIADDAIIQLELSLDDLRHNRISRFNLKTS